MNRLTEFTNKHILPGVSKFSNTKVISAIKDGLIITMPFTLIGSLFMILGSFPYKPVADLFNQIGWTQYFNMATGATFNIMAMFSVVAITNQWVHSDGYDGVPAGLFALAAFVILLPQSIDFKKGTKTIGQVTNVIDKNWTGAQGMIIAIILGMIVGAVYSWFMKKKITIKMPPEVPSGVSNAFSSLIPGATTVGGATLIAGVINACFHTDLAQLIYNWIQEPIQGVTDTFGGLVIFILLMCGCWAIGIHGPMVVNGILGPILLANTLQNVSYAKKGTEFLETHGHIFIQPLIDQFVNVTGTGMTFGLVIYMLFFAKSAVFKKLGRLEAIPMIFNINEPILFGVPIVLNPLLIPPFIITPLISGCLTYGMIKWGFLPVLSGVQVPWTTPAIISGYLIGGWKYMLWQILMLLMTILTWLPFARMADRQQLKKEKEQA